VPKRGKRFVAWTHTVIVSKAFSSEWQRPFWDFCFT
jgi:hypothetical protein